MHQTKVLHEYQLSPRLLRKYHLVGKTIQKLRQGKSGAAVIHLMHRMFVPKRVKTVSHRLPRVAICIIFDIVFEMVNQFDSLREDDDDGTLEPEKFFPLSYVLCEAVFSSVGGWKT